MKTNAVIVSMFTAGLLTPSAGAFAHEECDDDGPSKHHAAKPAQITPAQKPSGARIAVKLFQYQPGKTQVKSGPTVTWVKQDEIYHSVTADKSGFAAPLDGKDKSFSFTFSQPGIYSYFCDRHEHMRGEIEVD